MSSLQSVRAPGGRRERAVDALKRGASESSQQQIDSGFDDLCVELVAEWILGENKFEIASRNVEHWAGRIYEELIDDELPEASTLYTRFSLTLSRAQYVARILRSQAAARWRPTVREGLRRRLEERESDAMSAIGRSIPNPDQRFELTLRRWEYEEMKVLYDGIVDKASSTNHLAPPRSTAGSPRFIQVSVTATLVVRLLEAIRGDHA